MPATLGQLIDTAIARLRDASPSPRADVEALALQTFNLSRAALIARADSALGDAQTAQFLTLIERRRAGEPIAYLTGRREFWSLDLIVSPATLIPRPETELLVEHALRCIPIDAPSTVFDLGTGTGAIALAVAHERPLARVIATDCVRDALTIARANATRLRLTNIDFREGAWFVPLQGVTADVIVSNPPYVRADDPHLATGDLRFEPRTALVGGSDGLAAIRQIVAGASARLRPGGWLLVEHGFDQAAAVHSLLAQARYVDIRHEHDAAGQDRLVVGRRA